MKKMRLAGHVIVAVMLMTLLILGCGKRDVTGTYQLENHSDRTLILYNNGKGLMYTTQFDYSVKDGTITITAIEGSTKGTISRKAITFEPSNDTFASFFTGKWNKKK
jgi:major membrane immunogen (membrane-anchored lipoprotein)